MSDRTLQWCVKHEEPAWLYSDGSVQCMCDLIVERASTPSDHLLEPLAQVDVQVAPSPYRFTVSDLCRMNPGMVAAGIVEGSVAHVIASTWKYGNCYRNSIEIAEALGLDPNATMDDDQ